MQTADPDAADHREKHRFRALMRCSGAVFSCREYDFAQGMITKSVLCYKNIKLFWFFLLQMFGSTHKMETRGGNGSDCSHSGSEREQTVSFQKQNRRNNGTRY